MKFCGNPQQKRLISAEFFYLCPTMKPQRLIFVTNDDSYASKGFEAALTLARKFGEVVAVAPMTPQSGKSQAFSIYDPLFVKTIRKEEGLTVYGLGGTPVDCVKWAFDYLLADREVGLVISGINHGSNSAVNVLYSGTMGAAIEGSFYGCPAIGLSLTDHAADADFEASMIWGERIIRSVLAREDKTQLCLNVNVPVGCPEQIKGLRVCRQAKGFWRESFSSHRDPHDREYFWLTGAFLNDEPESEDTDERALSEMYVSVVPVQVDMTDYRQLSAVGKMLADC